MSDMVNWGETVFTVLTRMMNAGDEEGGIEMNTSIVLMKEFCTIFKDEAPTTRIVSFSELPSYIMSSN